MRTNQDEAEEPQNFRFRVWPWDSSASIAFRIVREPEGRRRLPVLPILGNHLNHWTEVQEPLDGLQKVVPSVRMVRSCLIAASLPLPLFCARTFHTDWRFTSLGGGQGHRI